MKTTNAYFFMLGRNAALSTAEIESVLAGRITGRRHGPGFFIVETQSPLDPAGLQKQLGGTVKIGQVVLESNPASLPQDLTRLLSDSSGIKKLNFGVNNYGFKFDALAVKKALRSAGVSARLVASREPALSSVIAQKEILNKSGVELNCFKFDDSILVGKTVTCQPFEELSRRDWDRPAKDELAGMMPPKLAKIMINLAAADKSGVLLDPFCGSGTILMEAALMGFNVIGSDVSEKAIEDTRKNFNWLKDQDMLARDAKIQLFSCDARLLEKQIAPNSVSAIVTEPYLGPPLRRSVRENDARKIKNELEKLYAKMFSVFAKILKKSGRAVIVAPVFMLKTNIFINILWEIKKSGFEIVNPIVENGQIFPEQTIRHTILYSRPGQIVGREILILKKI
ncbi:MAG: DNA methyltransferase [Patescibacteria group bacterium]|nr:DNA methyltransferase [Patescibacteria group bacterium]